METKYKIDWSKVKTRDDVIRIVNEAYEEGYSRGTQEGWAKHKKAADNTKGGRKPKKEKKPDVTVNIDAVLDEREKAYKFSIDGGEYWMPKSQLSFVKRDDGGNITQVMIPHWLAADKALDPESRQRQEELYIGPEDDDIPF